MANTIGGFQATISDPDFQNWFRGSRIVDAAGDPLVVWHGLKEPITHIDQVNKRVLFSPAFPVFDTSLGIEPGAWFSPDPGVASLHGYPAPFFLRALDPAQEESPIRTPPVNGDAIYRMRSSRKNLWEAWEIAVFDQSQIRLAFNPDTIEIV